VSHPLIGPQAWRPVDVEVPATSANLGPGFDAFALAVEMVDRFRVEPTGELRPGGVEVSVEGEGEDVLPRDGTDAFTKAFELGLSEELGRETRLQAMGIGWRIGMQNAIPVARGLGSSAAAVVGGIAAARAMVGGDAGPPERIVASAASIEGHPDNVAAAVFGGFTIAISAEQGPIVARFDPPPRLHCVLSIPDRPLDTPLMRAALPETGPYGDAVHNVGRAALLVAAFAQDRPELLRAAMDDRLHEPYREGAYPELPRLLAAARDAGALGAALSGAGSTIIAFADDTARAATAASALEREAATIALPGRAVIVRPRAEGVRIMGARTG